jgi:hypothetical protein
MKTMNRLILEVQASTLNEEGAKSQEQMEKEVVI